VIPRGKKTRKRKEGRRKNERKNTDQGKQQTFFCGAYFHTTHAGCPGRWVSDA